MPNKKTIIIVMSSILLIMIVIGTTYAYFTANISGEESSQTLTVTGGTLSIAVDGGNSFNVQNVIPGSQAKITKTITLTGTNTTDLNMPYTMSLVVESNTFSDNAISYTLESEIIEAGTIISSIAEHLGINNGASTIELGSGEYTKGNNMIHTYVLKIYFLETDADQNEDQGKEISAYVRLQSGEAITGSGEEFDPGGEPSGWSSSNTGTLLRAIKNHNVVVAPKTTPGKEQTTQLSSYYAVEEEGWEDNFFYYSLQSTEVFSYGTGFEINPLNGDFTLTGIINGTFDNNYSDLVNKYIVDDTLLDGENYIEGKYLYKIKTMDEEGNFTFDMVEGEPLFISMEASFSSTADDYGTSYYYRGSVENNYVMFANMCWRIVRVVGDGSIKLVLYNYNPNAAPNPCDANHDGEGLAFAKYNGESYLTRFNEFANSNAYVGFKHGIPGSDNYTDEHANDNNSLILNRLQEWYSLNNQFKDYESSLADTIWCNDKSIDTVYPYGTLLGFGTNQTGYSSKGRIAGGSDFKTEANPSLVCPSVGIDGKLSKFTVDDKIIGNGSLAGNKRIGLLTADEIAFAGGAYLQGGTDFEESTYYLEKNASEYAWWTLSPNEYYGTLAYVSYVYDSSYIEFSNVNSYNALRPSLSLLSSTTISGGNGTSSNPYVVSN